jgi:hypothetical protein
MDLSDNLYDLIFDTSGSVVSVEDSISSFVSGHSSDNVDRIFAIVQIYEYGEYIKGRIRDSGLDSSGMGLIVEYKIYYLISKIIDQIEGGFGGSISIYSQEYDLIDSMFSSMLGFYERVEDYSRCALILRIRDSFFGISKKIN